MARGIDPEELYGLGEHKRNSKKSRVMSVEEQEELEGRNNRNERIFKGVLGSAAVVAALGIGAWGISPYLTSKEPSTTEVTNIDITNFWNFYGDTEQSQREQQENLEEKVQGTQKNKGEVNEQTKYEGAQKQEYLDKLASTTDTFTLQVDKDSKIASQAETLEELENQYRKNQEEESQETYGLLEIDRNNKGNLGERLERRLEKTLEEYDSGILFSNKGTSYVVEQGDIQGEVFARDIIKQYRNGEAEHAQFTFVPFEQEHSKQYHGMVLLQEKWGEPAPYVVEHRGENSYRLTKLIMADDENKLVLSKNDIDIHEDVNRRDISRMSYDVWSNTPKMNELIQPTRNAQYYKELGGIEQTPHEMMVKGISSFNGELCSKGVYDEYCISRESFANNIGISSVYAHAAEQAIEDVSKINRTPIYGYLKGDNENVSSWLFSTAFPGDDNIAQAMTHYTGKVLTGNFSNDLDKAVDRCSQYQRAEKITSCMDNSVERIIDRIPSRRYR